MVLGFRGFGLGFIGFGVFGLGLRDAEEDPARARVASAAALLRIPGALEAKEMDQSGLGFRVLRISGAQRRPSWCVTVRAGVKLKRIRLPSDEHVVVSCRSCVVQATTSRVGSDWVGWAGIQ